jgi:hypothetical protein
MIESLSLLGIRSLSAESFELLNSKSINFVDLSPSIMGIDLSTDRLNIKTITVLRDYLFSWDISLNAVQGIFFGLNAADSCFSNRVESRLQSICDAMDVLSCENIYVGAPNLRRSAEWSRVVERTFQIAEARNKRVIVENICLDPCSRDLLQHYAGLDSMNLENICVDISNFTECAQMSEIFDELFVRAKYVHLSGKNHALPTEIDVRFKEKQTVAQGMNKRITYEFLGYELAELAGFFDKQT